MADAQPLTPGSLGEVIALLEMHGTSAADPGLVALKEFVARNGDMGLPTAHANRAINEVWDERPPGCDKSVFGFEVNAQPDGPDVAAMVYSSWVATSDDSSNPGVLSPASGVNFVFLNLNFFPPLVGTVPWESTRNRTQIIVLPSYGRTRHEYVVRYSRLTEMGPGQILGLFFGQDTPTGGPSCVYAKTVVVNGSSDEPCIGNGCPGPRPYDSHPPPYGPPWP
ncbi:hypothetical protein [Nocardia sp. NPDC049526]|uniref:hypothetical protein n=1 Tax=Nocardia sp. NPDC049526 TaxID=3364316 RepID=UPI0037BA30B4